MDSMMTFSVQDWLQDDHPDYLSITQVERGLGASPPPWKERFISPPCHGPCHRSVLTAGDPLPQFHPTPAHARAS